MGLSREVLDGVLYVQTLASNQLCEVTLTCSPHCEVIAHRGFQHYLLVTSGSVLELIWKVKGT